MDIYFYTKRLDVAATSLTDLASYIAALAAPTTATNIATINRVTDKLEAFVQSDSGEPLNLYFSPDGTNYEAWSTSADTTLAVGLGWQDPNTGFNLASTTSFAISGTARVGTLALNTQALREALVNAQQQHQPLWFTLHVRKTSAAGVTETIALLPVQVRPGVLTAAPADNDGISYTSEAAFLAGAVHPRTAITSLTGGGATALDGIVTAALVLPTGYTVLLSYGRVGQTWQLVAGTDAEDVPNGIVRPDDYDATSNARVWVQL